MKYKLLKDLPWMKAGTIVWIERDMLRTDKSILAAECYEATKNYFFVEDEGSFNAGANPSDGVWFEPLTTEQPTQEIEPLLPNRAYSQQGYGEKFNGEDIGDKLNELITAVNRLQKGK